MRASSKSAPLYARGKYRLEWDRRRDGSLRSPFLQIVWYDEGAGRNRSRSTGTEDIDEAEVELDKLYLKEERGQTLCPTCGQPRGAGRFLVTDAISNYLIVREARSSISAIRSRLSHVHTYLADSGKLDTYCDEVTEEWIDAFREWALEVPVFDGRDENGNDTFRDRAASTVEASVRQLQAAINYAHERRDISNGAAFRPKKPAEVDRTPSFRADVPLLAAMFRYCVDPEAKTDKMRERYIGWRKNLLRFLQASVATWARPDAIYDISTTPERNQWHPQHQALNLNQRGRAQTKKHRPVVPVARQLVPILSATKGFLVPVTSIRQAWEEMAAAIGLPGDREAGTKSIRRSMAKLARARLGERDWVEGQIMLGHRPHSSTSDIYAPFEPDYLSRAREVTEEIIAEIEKLVPGAFATPSQSNDTGETPE